ncbi:MAG TPA: alkaline phosphatase family protein [Xanthomonadaceae bacterium]|jgi:phospholipase C|nr:alkaline phosphatase family protein [Xanthomonadaceae bacterium]
MSILFSRVRLLPLVIGLLATGLAAAQSTTVQPATAPDTTDAAFRKNIGNPAAIHPGAPGGMIEIRNTRNGLKITRTTAPIAQTPIQHVILIIGENRTFDHVFATYTPPAGQTVNNLLSEGIVTAAGKAGANVALAKQWQASDTTTYSNSPTKTTAFATLPQMNTNSAPKTPYYTSVATAEAGEAGLPTADYVELTTGGTGIAKDVVDTRFPSSLPNAPVDMHASITGDAYAGSPTHRFFQMWQQLDCTMTAATAKNPSGCQMDLFPWVGTTVGASDNGKAQPTNFTNEWTYDGSDSMQFLDMAAGDVPYFKTLATTYAIADNMHQSVMGGTGANHIMLGFGTPIYYSNSAGGHAVPPSNQIENPDPQTGTNNWYTQDGYSGGSYVDCASAVAPGVTAINNYLTSLPYSTFWGRNCAQGYYYLVNNYNPGYLGDGTAAPLGSTTYTTPPTTQNNIGLLMTSKGVTWSYYGEGWDKGAEDGDGGSYCNICNPFLFSTGIMTNATNRANLKDVTDLYTDITNNTLPQVSIVKPDGNVDGHPASSKLELFEGFVQNIVTKVQANPAVWDNTAIFITMDEGGGYYDSGYVQPIDFFGDGTRIPLIAVSPWSSGGTVVHTYYDHVSFDKFIEANWALNAVISTRSRDNLPNPIQTGSNIYAPINAPAIGNLMDMFNFTKSPGTTD